MTNGRRYLPPDQVRREHIQPLRHVIPLKEANMPRTERQPEVEYDRKADAFTITLGAGRLDFVSEEATSIISLLCEALRLRGNRE